MREEVSFLLEDFGNGDLVEEIVDIGEDKGNYFVDGYGGVLFLFEEFG